MRMTLETTTPTRRGLLAAYAEQTGVAFPAES